MVQQQNGRADVVGSPIQLGDFLPERREVVVNGQTYRAWVTSNRRFPRSVQAELDMARNRYLRAVGPLLNVGDTDGTDEAVRQAERTAALERADVAFARYTTDALIALLPGLGEQEADLIDTEAATRLLTELGYFQEPEQPKIEAAEVTTTEGKGPLTGASSSPGSRATTRRVGQKRS